VKRLPSQSTVKGEQEGYSSMQERLKIEFPSQEGVRGNESNYLQLSPQEKKLILGFIPFSKPNRPFTLFSLVQDGR